MLLQELEDAAWMLEVGILRRRLAVPEAAARAAVAGLVAARAEALFARARGAVRLHPFVLPRRRVVVVLLRVPAREEAVEVLSIGERVLDDHRRVRVVLDVLLEPEVVLEDVVHDPAEERDVGPGADGGRLRRHGAR